MIEPNNSSATIEVNGIQIGVVERNRPVDHSVQSPCLVLIHGFTGSAAGWGPLLDAFANAGLHVVALDMPGHGHSSAPLDAQRYNMAHCQEDILATLHRLGVASGQAILLGYSMGGRIALYTAFSGYFRALILESASPGIADPIEREQRRLSDNALAERIEHEGIAAFVDYWENIPLFASQHSLPEAQQAALHMQRLQNTAFGLAQSLRGIGTGTQPALHERLTKLHIPVLLITGALDKKFCTIAQQMSQCLPDVKHSVIQGAGHTVHLEQTKTFVALVKQFCADQQ
jgi:2-succinyl-6-hydroxy-2,4-cyclohexadiene-1-carboxylate synthase